MRIFSGVAHRWRALLAAILMAISTTAVAVVAVPTAASAAAFVAPFWVTYCSGCRAVVPRDGLTIKVPFGLISTGRVTGAKVTLDTSRITSSRVTVVGVEGPCTRAKSIVTCNFGTIGAGKRTARLLLRARPGVSGGSAGTVKLRSSVPSTNRTASGGLDVSWDPSATDIAVGSSATRAKIGGTSTVTFTVHNFGPSVQPWVVLSGMRAQPGTRFVSSNRCVRGAGGIDCRVDNLAVGATVAFTLVYRVTGCDRNKVGGGYGALSRGYQDTYGYNEAFTFRVPVTGC